MIKKMMMLVGAAFFGAVQASGVDVSNWADLKNNLQTGSSVKLTSNITQSSDACAVYGTVTLDLNGYTLKKSGSRRLLVVQKQGYYSTVLTIQDSSSGGKITSDGTKISDNGGCIYVGSGGSLTLSSGTITGASSSGNAGAIYNDGGTVTINGGSIESCSSDGNAGVLFNGGTANVYGGVFEDNKAAIGGVFYGYQKSINIYGGKYSGNTTTYSEKSNFYAGWSWGNNGKLFGGVFAADPTLYAESHNCLSLQDGATVTQVGSWYVVGKNVVESSGTLKSGSFTFDPTTYGVSIYSKSVLSGSGTSYTVSAPIVVSIPSVEGATVSSITADGSSFLHPRRRSKLRLAVRSPSPTRQNRVM